MPDHYILYPKVNIIPYTFFVLQVPPLAPDVLAKLRQESQINISYSTSEPTVKGILKKPSNSELGQQSITKKENSGDKFKNGGRRKNGHVNYAFDFENEKKPNRPKTVTVINKRTGKSKPLELNSTEKENNKNSRTISVEVH